MAKTVLEETIDQLESRAKELKPLHDEYVEVVDALSRINGGVSTPAPRARPSTVSAPSKAKTKPVRKGRPKGSGQRGKQAVEIIVKKPGITLPEIAKKMGIKDNYLYRVLPGLQQEGLIKKDGKGWFPA